MTSPSGNSRTRNILPLGSRIVKRGVDLLLSAIALLATGWIVLIAALVARLDTGQPGFFRQTRIGRGGQSFRIAKLCTMRPVQGYVTMITVANDPRITPVGRFLRRVYLDELPQLWNVLRGQMSLVGPRPDVPGFADLLPASQRDLVLSVRPGMTGPATLGFTDEATLLAGVANPNDCNRVVFDAKTIINQAYVMDYSIWRDFCYMAQTALGRPRMVPSFETPGEVEAFVKRCKGPMTPVKAKLVHNILRQTALRAKSTVS